MTRVTFPMWRKHPERILSLTGALRPLTHQTPGQSGLQQ